MQHRILRRAIAVALYGGTASVLVVSPNSRADEPAKDASRLEAVTVVGSRIKRSEIETSQPVFTLERIDLERTGLTSVVDVLTDLTANGASVGLAVNNGNTSGSSTINLRSCGSNRTLVLVNGRRWVSQLGGSVDLSTIPFAAVERIEVLKDGASAIYGADAICGVINITLRDRFEGAQASAYVGQNSYGDGRKEAYDLTMGTHSERMSGLFSASYTKQEPILAGDREISRAPLYGFPENSSAGRASSTTPYGTFRPVAGGPILTLDPSKPGCRPNQDCPDAIATSDFRTYDPTNDGYNFALDNYLVQPQETHSLYTQGKYEIADNVRLRAEMLYNERTSEAQLAGQPITAIRISSQSIYNPFGVDVAGAAFRTSRAPRTYSVNQDTWRFGLGAEGEFVLMDRGLSWDVNYSYSDNESLMIKRGFFEKSRFDLATGASFVDSAGVARCGTAAAPIAGCVPLNLTGGQDGITSDMLAYLSVAPRNVVYQETRSYSANLSGELFELPAGPLSFAAGLESRKESGYTDPDPLTQLGTVIGDTASLPTRGGYSLDEGYLELAVPVLKDVTMARALEFSLATRHSRYSNFGVANNPKFGFRYQPIEDVLLRGNYAEGFRAPSISELFGGQSTSFPQAADPCSSNRTIFLENASVRARCASAGVPANYVQNNGQAPTLVGGNPDLSPETARTKTLGIVYSPGYVNGLSLALDWYNMRLSNSIGSRSAQQILTDCFVSNIASRCALITRDLSGAQFANPGEITRIRSIDRNFDSGFEVEGFDFTVDYAFRTDFGQFQINWDNAYTSYFGDLNKLARGERNGDGDPSSGNVVGTQANNSSAGARWRLQSRLATTWSRDSWTATLGANYTSALDENCSVVVNTANAIGRPELHNRCSDPDRLVNLYALQGTEIVAVPTQQPENRMGSRWYFDAQMTWTAPWKGTVTAGIRNLFDTDPPLCTSCFANQYETNYRTPGRYYYMSYRQTF